MLPQIPLGEPAWWFILGISFAVLIIGVGKAGFGGTVMVLALPVIANTIPAETAIGVMLPILLFADLLSNIAHYKHISPAHIRWTLSGAVVGITAAALLLAKLDSTDHLSFALELIVGSLCLLLVIFNLYRAMGGKVPNIPASPWAGRASGTFAGITSTLAHSGGPLISLYLLEAKLNKQQLVSTLVLFFGIVNVCKLPVYCYLGLINQHTLIISAWFAPLIPLGIALGLYLHKRIPEKLFMLIIYLGAAAGAITMLTRALV